MAWLYADVNRTRQGIGSSLIHFALEYMEENDSIEVLAGNTPAISPYSSFGFSVVAAIHGSMPRNEGFAVKVYLMK